MYRLPFIATKKILPVILVKGFLFALTETICVYLQANPVMRSEARKDGRIPYAPSTQIDNLMWQCWIGFFEYGKCEIGAHHSSR